MSVKTRIHDGPISHGPSGDCAGNSRLGRRFVLSSFGARCPNFESALTLTFIARWAHALILIGRSLAGGYIQARRRTTGPIARQAMGRARLNRKATNKSACHVFEPHRIGGGMTVNRISKGLTPIRGRESRSDGTVQNTLDTDMSSHGAWLRTVVPVSDETHRLARNRFPLRGGCKAGSDCIGHRLGCQQSVGDGHADEEDSKDEQDTYEYDSQSRWLARGECPSE